MKYFLFYFLLLIFLSGCGGGGVTSVNANDDISEVSEVSEVSSKRIASIADAKENAQAVRDFFYRNRGVLSRKLQRKSNTETTRINCTIGHINQTKFTEYEYEKYDYNYVHEVLNKEFFDCLNDPQPSWNFQGSSFNEDTYNGLIENIYTATTKSNVDNTHDRNTWEHATIYNDFSIKHKNKSKSQYYGMNLLGVTNIKLDIGFDNEIDTVIMNGGFSSKIVWKNMDKNISFITEKYEVIPDSQFFEIIGEDGTGIHWKKMDILNEGEMILTNATNGEHKKGSLKMTIKTESIVIKQACSNQYEIKTIIPFFTLANDQNPSKGEMTIYNNTNDVLTKLSVIDAENVELSSDFDKDGIVDYKEIIEWDNILNNPESDKICR
jgi:hypothetical protein